jgi:hypothetical protein
MTCLRNPYTQNRSTLWLLRGERSRDPVDSSPAEARRGNLPQVNLIKYDMNVNRAFLEMEDPGIAHRAGASAKGASQ